MSNYDDYDNGLKVKKSEPKKDKLERLVDLGLPLELSRRLSMEMMRRSARRLELSRVDVVREILARELHGGTTGLTYMGMIRSLDRALPR